MSLQLVAQHLAEKGRGPDSTLVHMSNREVAGLNALARKHGGELSVNPDTGLPEAGFLDNLLPMVAGGALTAFTGIDPMMAAGIVGGITALDSKDLSKGLVAGLGAYGGAGMVGGLAGLGAAGADTATMAAPEYQAAVGTGAGNFVDAPMASLKTLGGGSVLKGSLPILAGLAPAAVEAFDEGDEGDGAPAQHKGYIRKYAFDPATGQYKQVGVYEAGGDPNADVSGKAGTAGAYGGVSQSEYEAARGMADGGTTSSSSDSSRIYDYLMGRGPNPMQFTHTAPQVDYNVNKTPAPITPTTQILESPYDQYGNVNKGGNYDPERRAEELSQKLDDYGTNSDTGETFTRGEYLSLTGDRKKEVDAKFALEHPYKNAVLEGVKNIGIAPIAYKLFNAFAAPFRTPVNLSDPLQATKDFPDLVKTETDFNGNFYTPPSLGGPEAGREQTPQQAQDARVAAFDAGRTHEGGGGGGGYGYSGAPSAGSDVGRSAPGSAHNDARGGYLQHGQFDQRMARGGLPAPHAFYRQGKFGYKGPQVYADGGGIADLEGHYNLGGYSDGGRLLKGPGDGISDDIPAIIGHNQPARLADNEFVIPARIVSEIGNGSTDAGARALYKMMDRIQQRRAKTVGKDKIAVNSGAYKELDKL